MAKLTEHFSREELACKCGCGFSEPDIRLVWVLELLRTIINEEITVNSGCRCQQHNKDVGGETDPPSYHTFGMASDISVKDSSGLYRAAKLLEHWSGGFHYYPETLFIHLDIGPNRRW